MSLWIPVLVAKTTGFCPGLSIQLFRGIKSSWGLQERFRHISGGIVPVEVWSKKMPLSTVQQLAGHKSIQVTAMIYANLLVDELHEAYDEMYSPLILE